MAQIDDALRKLARAHHSDDPVTISAADARLIHNLLSAHPQRLAVDLADAIIDANFAARDAFLSHTVEEEAYWCAHNRVCQVLRALINVGWIDPQPRESVDD